MTPPPPTLPRDLWIQDGSLRDIYIHEAGIDDWVALLTLAKRSPHVYLVDGEPCELPAPQRIFANRAAAHLLSLRAGSADLNCHFFSIEEIELDIDPSQVVDLETHEAVLLFVESLATVTGKPAAITMENSRDLPLLRFEPREKRWQAF